MATGTPTVFHVRVTYTLAADALYVKATLNREIVKYANVIRLANIPVE